MENVICLQEIYEPKQTLKRPCNSSSSRVRGESKEADYTAAAEASLPLIYGALRDIELDVYPKDCYFNVDIPTHPAQNKVCIILI